MKDKQPFSNLFLNVVKVLLVLITFGFVFYKLFYAYHIGQLSREVLFTWSWTKILVLLLALMLTAVNWFTEAIKWRNLINKEEDLSTGDAIKAVLCGITLSMLTPNQIGDFVGRVMQLKRLNKIKGSLVAVIGHTAQVIMTCAFGLLAFVWLLSNRHIISAAATTGLVLGIAVAIVLALMGFLNIHLLARIRFIKRAQPYLDVFALYRKDELISVIGLSLLRYLTFVSQYLLLLYVFDIHISLITGAACVCAALFVQSFVPSFLLIDIGMRGATALWFFESYTTALDAVLLSVYSLWMINLMLPGLVGLYFITQWRWNKS